MEERGRKREDGRPRDEEGSLSRSVRGFDWSVRKKISNVSLSGQNLDIEMSFPVTTAV